MPKFAAAVSTSILAVSLLFAGAYAAQAQSVNPLQQPSTSQQPARTSQTTTRSQTAPKAEAKAETKAESTEEKPKRQRSAAQLANDNRLRRCGQEWRANKEKLTGQGYNWIKFSTECRARLKAAGQ